MKFKLTKLHLFLILLAVLIFSSMGIKILEGMDSDEALGEEAGTDDNLNTVSDGSDYDPNNNAGENELSKIIKPLKKKVVLKVILMIQHFNQIYV